MMLWIYMNESSCFKGKKTLETLASTSLTISLNLKWIFIYIIYYCHHFPWGQCVLILLSVPWYISYDWQCWTSFFFLSFQVGCLAELNKVLLWFNFKNSEEMHMEFCSNNFFEMKHLVHSYLSGVIPPFYQDLFLEQRMLSTIKSHFCILQ